MLKKAFSIVINIAALAAAMSFSPPGKTGLLINFENYVGGAPLRLDSATYKNELGQDYTVSKFKYYIGNVHLTEKDGKEHISSQYFLINEEEEASKQIHLSDIPDGDYTTISFIVGVDSVHNCGGAQTDALDPVNGMFWTWNTGYIFLKMEGKSLVSKSPGDLLAFHIGGYKSPYNCVRTVRLTLKNGLKMRNGISSNLNIKTDLSELFKTPTTIDFSKTSSVTDFHGATTIADNYCDMFSIMP